MRIAIASENGIDVSGHLGRCAGFVIYDIAEGGARQVEFRENIFTHHHTAGCEGEEPSQHRSHNALLSALSDCQIVISRGMGRRIRDDLASVGLEGIVTDITSVKDVAESLQAGKGIPQVEGECEH